MLRSSNVEWNYSISSNDVVIFIVYVSDYDGTEDESNATRIQPLELDEIIA